jgi:hypothetical protein
MRSLVVGMAVLCVGLAGCKKSMDNLEKQGYESGNSSNSGPYSGGGNPTVGGAAQAVRGAATRIVTAAELHDLHLMMNTAKLSSGKVPTKQETWDALNRPDGNQKLRSMIQDGSIVLVDNPQEEGLWAYAKEAPTQGGWVLTHGGAERLTAQEFATRFGGN